MRGGRSGANLSAILHRLRHSIDTGTRPVPDAAFDRNAPYAPTPDNRPIPLYRGPLNLTRDGGWQMSFGERAALEGILAQLRPSLAVEIGTADGGSLERIATYSDEVHSIDLTHEPVVRHLPRHVVLHTGPSAALLPDLLESFVSKGRGVDLALVDGDHSYEGVCLDLTMLLDSPATERSVILVHDTMNAEIRAGIESVELERFSKVVYYELDFVPGYVYREGACHGMAWGGIGLVLTDRSRDPEYPWGPRPTRYYEPFSSLQQLRTSLLAQSQRLDEPCVAYPRANAVNPGFLVPLAVSSPPLLLGGLS